MALDHFVPQVYLKQWADDANKGLLRAIRKSDLKQFTPGTKAVCAMSGGNTNLLSMKTSPIGERQPLLVRIGGVRSADWRPTLKWTRSAHQRLEAFIPVNHLDDDFSPSYSRPSGRASVVS
jgi:hypothetical protein